MSETCKTVAIKGQASEGNPSGVVIINELEFDANTMTKCNMPEITEPVVIDPVTKVTKKSAKVVAPWSDSKEVV